MKNPAGAKPDGVFKSGGKTRNRTGDTLIFSQLLYRLSYLAVRGINRGKGSKGRREGASTGILPDMPGRRSFSVPLVFKK
jgi:hypothetical protein